MRRRPPKVWMTQDIDQVLELLEEIEKPGFSGYTRSPMPERKDDEGDPVCRIDGLTYHPVVMKLWDLLYSTSAFMDPYQPLPEDGLPLDQEADWGEWLSPQLETIVTMSQNQIRRYLILCTRAERFCEGAIASGFDSNVIPSALRRLRDLQVNITPG